MKVRNTFIIFIVSGFWHGANWTFIVWGILNAIYFLPLLLANKNRNHIDIVAKGSLFPNIKEFSLILINFGLIVLAWVFFRAENINHATNYLLTIFSKSILEPIDNIPYGLFIILLFFISVEWFNRDKKFGLERLQQTNWVTNIIDKTLLFITFWIIVIWHHKGEVEFIYFQF